MSESEDVRVFRERVEQGAQHLSSEAVQRAVDYFLGQAKVGRSHVAGCVELAGLFTEVAGAKTDAPRADPLPSSPLGTYTGEAWVAALTPRVEEERGRLWGTPDPPWTPDQWQEAVRWLEEQEREGRRLLGVPEGEWTNEAADEVRAAMAEHLPRLTKLTGWRTEIVYHRYQVRIFSRAEGRWTITSVEAFGSTALRRIARFCAEVSEVTGFPEHDVAAWVLFGVAPVFRRAEVLGADYAYIDLGGQAVEPDPETGDSGRRIARSTSVSVVFRSPDVTHEDLRHAREALRRSWQLAGAPDVDDRQRLTEADRALLTAWRQAGGPDGRRGQDFWRDVQQRWHVMAAADPRLPSPPERSESIRRYWYLLEKKRAGGLLSHIPSEQTGEHHGEA